MLDNQSGKVARILPDTSILYKLLLERTVHAVDLNDLYIVSYTMLTPSAAPNPNCWASNFQSFKSFYPSNEPKRRTSHALKKVKEEEEDLL